MIGINTLNDFNTAGGIFPDSLICNFSFVDNLMNSSVATNPTKIPTNIPDAPVWEPGITPVTSIAFFVFSGVNIIFIGVKTMKVEIETKTAAI